ncbi:GntR family transcriptional regulator [Martelella sp. AD-3]|uniref:GntR family transcriptional regulator n=1 Tax=Martelella sp. AD-3 TaxID=686597 RepID=UPI000465ACF5|nr:GntR family transcriptional regulator [Martelella sp. AD-3]AMM83279.1 GntR family transcriptional regulator [Martelella sp. AD-3]
MATSDIIKRVRAELAGSATDIPLYKRLKTAIEAVILSNELHAGERLPGERALAESLGLSRVTVRKSFALLEEDGLLARRHGARTEVASKVEKTLSNLTSFSEDIRSRGMEPGCIWLSKQMSRPSPTEMMALGIGSNESILRMQRIRTADGKPIAVEIASVPQRFLPAPELVGHSLYDALEKRGYLPQRAIQRMRTRSASQEDSDRLSCPPLTPLLVTERRCFLPQGDVVEYCETRYRGDVYDFVFELRR